MQTFMPFADFAASASALDNRRLGKQRIEALAVLRSLLWKDDATLRHPCAHQWRGHEWHLWAYLQCARSQWMGRGFTDSLGPEMAQLRAKLVETHGKQKDELPPAWLGVPDYHRNHVCRLYAKEPQSYAALEPLARGNEFDSRANLWPVAADRAWVYKQDGRDVAALYEAAQPYRLRGRVDSWLRCPLCGYWANRAEVLAEGACSACQGLRDEHEAVSILRGEGEGPHGGTLAALERDVALLVRAARAGLPAKVFSPGP